MFSCTSDDDATLAEHSGCPCHTPDIQRLTRRINLDVSRRSAVAGIAASIASLASPGRSHAQTPASSAPRTQSILFNNVRVFDGTSAGLRDGLSVLVQDQ